MHNKTFIKVCSAILITLAIFPPIKYALVAFNIIGFTDLGNYMMTDNDHGDGVLADILDSIDKLKSATEEIYTNYLPFYSDVISTVSSVKLALNSPFSRALSRAAADNENEAAETDVLANVIVTEASTEEPEIEQNGGTATYILEEGRHRIYSVVLDEPVVNSVTGDAVTKFLDRAILISDDELERRVKLQAEQVNRIAAINKDVNFYVYLGTRFQECAEYDNYMTGEHNVKAQRDEFLSLLDKNIKYDYLKIDSIQDRVDKIYLTDHHWTPYGAHCGYTDIINMMAEDTPEIGEPLGLGEYVIIDNCSYYGSTARAAGLFNFAKDSFYFYRYNGLPEYTTKPANDLPSNMKKYEKGSFDKTQGADHYQTVFTAKNEFKKDVPENGRVLMMLGDSFSYSTAYLIASHFDRVIIINPSTLSANFKYSSAIEKYGVTDVLILLISDRLYGNVYNNTPLTNIVDE